MRHSRIAAMQPDASRIMGSYRLLGELGKGGMGVVWLAEHVQSRDRVALKTIRVPNESLLRSIRREVLSLARTRHPGVVRILDEGLEDGIPWYSMELLEGLSLRHWAQRVHIEAATAGDTPAGERHTFAGAATVLSPAALPIAATQATSLERSPGAATTALPVAPVLTLVRRLCGPLSYLHGEGIVHRDLKPENILVRPDGRPVIVDFGLAVFFGGTENRETLSIEAGVWGTATYMAPEQIRGELVDARADLYALGCILYELLTGRPPFLGGSARDVFHAHLSRPPVPPSRAAGGIPPALDDLVLRLLAKEPRQRLGYADVAAAALADLGAEVCPADATGSPSRAYLYRPGFAGRAHEMALLRKRLDDLDCGRGGLVLLGGASGVGKTRLAMEVAREALAREALVLAGECLDGDREPFRAFRKPLQAIADRCRELGPEEAERLLGARARLLAAIEPTLAGLPGLEAYPKPTELTGEAARRRMVIAVADTLWALAAHDATLLVLDDLQWVDPLSVEVLTFLLRSKRFARSSLLVLGTYRSEEVGDALKPLLQGAGTPPVKVGPLEERTVSAIAADMLALDRPPERLARYLAENSEGNPFFAAEYVRLAIQEGLVFRSGWGAWTVAAAGTPDAERGYAALPMPKSLRDLVARRLGGLPLAASRLADAAAVLGRESDALLLWEVTSLEEVTFVEASDELNQRGVLEDGGAGKLRFAHDTIREVAYSRLADAERVALHRRAAEGIARLYRRDSEAHLADLGRHWRGCGETEKAKTCMLAAARRAKALGALAAAAPLYADFLALAGGPSAESSAVRCEHAHEVLRTLGRLDEAEAELRRALEEARAVANRTCEAMAVGRLATIAADRGRPAEARTLYLLAIAAFRDLGDRWGEGLMLGNQGALLLRQGAFDEARALYEQALAIKREIGDRRGEGIIVGEVGSVCESQGCLEEARDHHTRAIAIFRELGDKQDEGVYLGNLAVVDAQRGQVDDARAGFERVLAIARETGDRSSEAIDLFNLADLCAEEGRTEAGLRSAEQALAIYCELGDHQREGQALSTLATLRRDNGDLDEARALCERAITLHREAGDRTCEGDTLGKLAGLHRLAHGDLAVARSLTLTGETILREVGDRISLAALLCEAGHLRLAVRESARPLIAEARELAAASNVGPASFCLRKIDKLERAQAAFEAGEHDRLFRGQLTSDLTAGQRRRLIAGGNLQPAP
ncbi:MAG: tetratricopeptide repeat protein [Candidatus Schekmanbacteria bacterium]|nr:tetratricopeptide repeat protein [Candidatus Schekmanbacteria bacterium]